ncbi:MAG: hypothetical protein AAFP76_08370 [Bacteroidota bacterium]
MKYKFITLIMVFLGTVVFQNVLAQGYQVPSRELVETLLTQLEKCKANLANAEKGLIEMKKNPGEYSLETYLWVENNAKEARECITQRREELDRLRKDYPGWFNSPTAFTDIKLKYPEIHSPRELAELLDGIELKITKVLAEWKKLPRPEH